jgi:putative peptidoglycan lipid II flippase
MIFAAAVPLWAIQGLTARAFYAARNTLTPMIAGTLITLASLPMYAAFFELWGPAGLAVASGAAILGHTVVLLVFVPRVIPELKKVAAQTASGLAAGFVLSAAAGAAAFAAGQAVALWPFAAGGHRGDVIQGAAGSIAFVLVVAVVAPWLGIDEPRQLWGKVVRRLRRR